MKSEFKSHPELIALLDRMIENSLSASEQLQVNAILRTNPGARRAYRSYLALHAVMAWEGREQSAAASARAADIDSSALPFDMRRTETERTPDGDGPRGSILLGWLGQLSDLVQRSPQATLMILAGALVGYFLTVMALVPLARWAQTTNDHEATNSRRHDNSDEHTAAWLAGVRRCRWKSQSPRFGASVDRQPLEIAEGIVELTFTNAVRVVIEAPARFEVQSVDRLRLDQGKLAAVVPVSGVGFAVVTPTAEVVDLGTEFGVAVDVAGTTDVHVLRGRVELRAGVEQVGSPKSAQSPAKAGLTLGAGQAARISAPGKPATSISFDGPGYADIVHIGRQHIPASNTEVEHVSQIWLSNLFDDRPGISLSDAMRSDTFRAAADVNDLGVERVSFGGEPVKEIAIGIRFDLTNLGWTANGGVHSIANDAWTGATAPTKNFGLRIRGEALSDAEAKVEEGIGAHANALVTFNLDDIRSAGRLPQQPMEFICDRAGINDLSIGGPGSVHMIVLLSNREAVQTVLVDGQPVELTERAGVWSVASEIGEAIAADGRFVTFRAPLDSSAKYLTLITTSAGDDSWGDAAAWVGARLQTSHAPETRK